MKFVTESEADIRWLADPSGYEVADVVYQIKDAGKWDEFLEGQQDIDGYIDADGLYDFLRHESDDALASVGLHNITDTATVEDVLKAWEAETAREYPGLKVHRDADGKPIGLELYTDREETTLYFETIWDDNDIDTESLDEDDVCELVKTRYTKGGKWDCDNPDVAEFEMWNK